MKNLSRWLKLAGVFALAVVFMMPAGTASARRHHRPVPQTQPQTTVQQPVEKPADYIDGLKGHTVVIDPGHGGSDSGAVGETGVREKDVTLAVGKKVETILQDSGATPIMTRTTDRDVYAPYDSARDELQARSDYANNNPQAELFLSIHCNAASNPAAHGMETYYYGGSWQGERFAELLNEELDKAGGRLNRGVKSANFYVLKHTNVPASLVELAFVTNDEEAELLSTPSYQDQIAKALATAIARYFNNN